MKQSEICSHCNVEKVESQRLTTPMLIGFNFELHFYKEIMMPLPGGKIEDLNISKICETCARRLMQILIDAGFKIDDKSYEW